MANGSGIEWTQATWNPVSGCTRASAGCDHCYAVTMTHRLEAMGQSKYAGLTVLNAKGDRHFNGVVRCDESALTIPLKWRKPRRIFVNSMSDLFHRDVPDAFIRKVFAVMSMTGQHAFQVLTKRTERMAAWFADESNNLSACQAELLADPRFDYLSAIKTPTGRMRKHSSRAVNGTTKALGDGNYWPLPNVWLGTSVENQATADERIPHLLRCPAAVRFLSCEPLLGPVTLPKSRCDSCGHCDNDPAAHTKCLFGTGGICRKCGMYLSYSPLKFDWVIAGGESGSKARPCNVEWIRSIVQQCKAAGVPCFVKQCGASPRFGEQLCPNAVGEYPWRDRKGGNPAEWPADLRVREMPKAVPA